MKMKIAANRSEQFIKSDKLDVSVILVYGPDQGLIRERCDNLITSFVGTLNDPFQNIELTSGELKDDASRLCDEALAFSMTGNKRSVHLRNVTDSQLQKIKPLLDLTLNNTLVILESGDLGPRSKLRNMLERADNGAALPCYQDDQNSIVLVIREALAARNITTTPDALSYLQSHLGGDRLVTRSELEKLALFKGDSGEVTLTEAQLCIGDSTNATLDNLVQSATSGNIEKAIPLLDRVTHEGAGEVTIIRAFSRHLTRLHLVKGHVITGVSIDKAMKLLRPPVFYKQTKGFEQQIKHWSVKMLNKCLSFLLEAEIQCKSSGKPSRLICQQTVLKVCAIGGAFKK